MRAPLIVGLLLLVIAAVVIGYGFWSVGYFTLLDTTALLPQATSQNQYAGKKILYVDSYHAEYDWSAGIARGLHSVLDPTGVDFRIIYMDTKRNTDETFKRNAALKVKREIESFKPDVVITADDNAFSYVVKEYYRDANLPVVFAGLNWDASLYGAPYSNTTGMVEISLTNQIIDHLKQFAKGNRLGFISADNETERKNLTYYQKLLGLSFAKAYFVKDLDAWKTAFTKLQNEVDIIIFENNAGIEKWDEQAAESYALSVTRVPVGTTNPWIMKYALLGITKIPEEQGEWSAETALRILDGTPPSAIPLVKNKRGNLMVNLTMADTLNVTFTPSVLKNAEVIQ